TIKGLGTLVGFGGWEAMGQAWKGLAQLATGLVLTSMPGLGAGKEIADTIATGRFKGAAGFSDVVSNLSRPSELSGCLEQIRLANRLHASGLEDILFAVKQGGHEIKPGVFTDPKTELDLMAREADGTTHGWQFKDMTGEDERAVRHPHAGQDFLHSS
ncbi:hypothetical protein GTY54_32890, partial [Streptomyces sp. SID625]|nr:hypothetical protein [Streptomyces sp. SID625]